MKLGPKVQKAAVKARTTGIDTGWNIGASYGPKKKPSTVNPAANPAQKPTKKIAVAKTKKAVAMPTVKGRTKNQPSRTRSA